MSVVKMYLLVVGGLLATWVKADPGGRSSGSITPLQEQFKMPITKTTAPILIDGVLDEATWQNIPGVSKFYKKFPTDEGWGTRQTLVKTTYDDKFLYIGVVAYDSGKAFIRTLKRDGGHDGSDGFGVVLDPLNQHTNGFFFVVNAYNAQSEDLITAGSSDGPNFSWDNKWFSATTRHEDKWIAEIAIPFKTLRYNSEQDTWG
ncbi:MAG TPA: carbohydrate binding family 9 domain-containing protein, partial [Phnomibacter sp.]|nr:carbohydrate binding family 9 domain-containing protein [Phnomibacter sp.]